MSDVAKRIFENVERVRGRIATAAQRSGRDANTVKLVAVTKYVSAEVVQMLVDAGCFDLGESRPQQLWEKAESIDNPRVAWHMIGHLQRNKIRRTLPFVSLLHSGDNLRLLSSLDEESPALPLPVLLEVNISGDAEKHGFAIDEVESLLPQIGELRRLRVRGLMAMAGRDTNADEARTEFARLRELRDRLRASAPPNVSLDELSMGMSRDYEAAIEEGATIVRVGSSLFEGIDS